MVSFVVCHMIDRQTTFGVEMFRCRCRCCCCCCVLIFLLLAIIRATNQYWLVYTNIHNNAVHTYIHTYLIHMYVCVYRRNNDVCMSRINGARRTGCLADGLTCQGAREVLSTLRYLASHTYVITYIPWFMTVCDCGYFYCNIYKLENIFIKFPITAVYSLPKFHLSWM